MQRFLALDLMSQAGLAVGPTIAIEQRYEALGPRVTTVVLAAVAIYEMVGPISARFALVACVRREAVDRRP